MSTNKKEPVAIGKVQSVDTGNVSIKVDREDVLNSVQVNQIVKIRSTKTGEKIIGMISKIMRRAISEKIVQDTEPETVVENIMRVNLIGTLLDKVGTKENVFKRTLNTVPSIDADCFLLEKEELSAFMNSVSHNAQSPLKIGKFTISEESDANLDGNKFFQRHAVIVGGTGSGKSWTVANILEKASKLPSVNSIVFDLHGEYKPLAKLDNAQMLKIAGPSDTHKDNAIFLPYWLLSYEEIEAMLLDRSDQNAPNQARALFDLIIENKRKALEAAGKQDILANFTIDSPIPYKIDNVLSSLKGKDEEMVPGSKTEKQGPLYGKLTRFIQRLQSKQSDKRLNFIFNSDESLLKFEWFETLVSKLLNFGKEKKGLKIIDFSEVPSDILPLIAGLIGRLVLSIQQWMPEAKRHPIALFCDEAHLYISTDTKSSIDERGLVAFERIAKEGRKYGVSLVVISQRPADVNKTVLSQCGNFIAMRLTNPDDQNVVKRLFPDNLGDFAEMLPILDIGESLIIGDAALLPSRVKVDEPCIKPNSATIDIWDEWAKTKSENGIPEAVESLRKQQK
jgi:hypothetical protein